MSRDTIGLDFYNENLLYLVGNIRMWSDFFHSFCILGMAVERYVMVCHPAASKTLLSDRNRIVFYIILMSCVGALIVFSIVDMLVHVENWFIRNFEIENLTISNAVDFRRLTLS